MKEFIEKLIGRLEEKENETVLKAPNTSDISNTEYQKWMMKSYGFKESIEIVNQLAEEYKPTTNLNIQEVIDNLEVYTVGRLKNSRVHITVEELQNQIDRLEQLAEEYNNKSVKGDLISRSALIDVLNAERKQDRSKAYGEHECDLIAGTIAMCTDFVKAMPTENDGWFPCSEKLPEEQKCKDGHIDPSEEVLVYIYYGENCVNNGCGVSRYWNSSKHHENPWIDLKYGKDNVIAWKPITPYQPKGE